MWSRAELKSKAKIALKNNYWRCVLVSFILAVIGDSGVANVTKNMKSSDDVTYAASYAAHAASTDARFLFLSLFGGLTIVVICLTIFVLMPLEVGGCRFFMENQTSRSDIDCLAYGFTGGGYLNVVLTMFICVVKIFLWTLLFIIPGIIKAYQYRMVPYILAENPQMDRKRVFELSRMMMKGNKFDSFVLDISFIGWYFVSAITFGIAFIFWVNPYITATQSELYTAVRDHLVISGGEDSYPELVGYASASYDGEFVEY